MIAARPDLNKPTYATFDDSEPDKSLDQDLKVLHDWDTIINADKF